MIRGFCLKNDHLVGPCCRPEMSSKTGKKMGDTTDDDVKFQVDDINTLVSEGIESVIGQSTEFNDVKVKTWSAQIADICMKKLYELGKPFKYTLSCGIMQKNGAGIHSGCCCYWDNVTDGICLVRWENPTMHCVVTVFGFAL